MIDLAIPVVHHTGAELTLVLWAGRLHLLRRGVWETALTADDLAHRLTHKAWPPDLVTTIESAMVELKRQHYLATGKIT